MKEKYKLLLVKLKKVGSQEINYFLDLQILAMIKIELYKNLMEHGLILQVMLRITKINLIENLIILSIF